MKSIEEMIEVMQAFDEGREIEGCAYCAGSDWRQLENPKWNWVECDYRIKDESKPELMTQRQLAELLAKGYGEFMVDDEMETEVYPTYFYSKGKEDKPVADNVRIRPWGSDEKLVPTAEVYEGFVGSKAESDEAEEEDEDEDVYNVGEWGQAGWVFYDKGFYSDGWRYMEAAPADLRVVDNTSTVDSDEDGYSNAESKYRFGYKIDNETGMCKLAGTDTSIGSGEANTRKLVDAMFYKSYVESNDNAMTDPYAANLCNWLECEHDGEVYDDWFLPSKYELDVMYHNLKSNGIGSFSDDYYCSSSECDEEYVWTQRFAFGYKYNSCRTDYFHVRPARCF